MPRPDSRPEWPGPALFEGPESPELVAELAHTLRSRLTSVLFLAESLHAGADAWDDGQRRQLALLSASAVKASVFTSNLMELARGGDDLVGIEPQPLSVAELLREVRDTLRPLTGPPNPSLRIRGDATGQRLGYPMALQRVVLALLTAALELTREGEVEIDVRARGPAGVEFAVHAPNAAFAGDSPDELERAVSRRSEGDGWSWSPVGLSIATARHLLDRLGIGLEVEAGAGRGLRFRFRAELPPLDTAPTSDGAASGSAAPDRGTGATAGASAQRSGERGASGGGHLAVDDP